MSFLNQATSVFLLVILLTFLTCKPTQAALDSAIKTEADRFHSSLIFDKNGIPYSNYSKTGHPAIGLQGNLHAVSTIALEYYEQYQKTANESAKTYFINNANWLVNTNMLKNRGSYSVYQLPFSWKNGNYTIEAPWRSAMANGEALSPLLTAYELTGNKTYFTTAKSLLNAFYVDVKDGGITYKTPHSGWWYEEYVSNNPTKEPRVLNGMIHAILGINEYYKHTNDTSAKYIFDLGILALKNDLPYYDNNGASFYDRLDLPANPFYKSLHVIQLEKLYKLTHEPVFKTFHDRWNNYNLQN